MAQRSSRDRADKTAATQRRRSAGALLQPDRPKMPAWIEPQLTQLVKEAPDGLGWLNEIKWDGYRMHARLERGRVQLLTRKGLDWTRKYPGIAEGVKALPASQAYLDGELCGLKPDGTTSFDIIQNASVNQDALVFFLFDLLFLDGEDLRRLPLIERKTRLAELLTGAPPQLQCQRRFNADPLGSNSPVES